MVKRSKVEEIAGVLEFDGLSSDDTEFMQWMEDHKAQNGGKLRISRGSRGVRVMFSKEADMAAWKLRSDRLNKKKG